MQKPHEYRSLNNSLGFPNCRMVRKKICMRLYCKTVKTNFIKPNIICPTSRTVAFCSYHVSWPSDLLNNTKEFILPNQVWTTYSILVRVSSAWALQGRSAWWCHPACNIYMEQDHIPLYATRTTGTIQSETPTEEIHILLYTKNVKGQQTSQRNRIDQKLLQPGSPAARPTYRSRPQDCMGSYSQGCKDLGICDWMHGNSLSMPAAVGCSPSAISWESSQSSCKNPRFACPGFSLSKIATVYLYSFPCSKTCGGASWSWLMPIMIQHIGMAMARWRSIVPGWDSWSFSHCSLCMWTDGRSPQTRCGPLSRHTVQPTYLLTVWVWKICRHTNGGQQGRYREMPCASLLVNTNMLIKA